MSKPQQKNNRLRSARANPKRNCPMWELLWSPLRVENQSPDVVAWMHNYSAQEIVIKRNGEKLCVEARHGDVIAQVDEFKNFQIALAFAEGFMEGHPDGGVL